MKDSLSYQSAGRVVQILAWIKLVGIILAIAIPMFTTHKPIPPKTFLFFLIITIPIFILILGKSIKQHRDWARAAGIIYGILLLIGFPIGTIIGAYILWCLIKGWDQETAQQIGAPNWV